jgi:uncharacterized protein
VVGIFTEKSYCLSNGLYIIENKKDFLVINKTGFRWAIIDERGISELKDFLNGNCRESELIKKLRKDKILNNPETAYDSSEINRIKKLSLVVLHTTNQCSLDCDYCYADANSSDDKMSKETAIKTIDRIVDLKPLTSVRLEFHGGEPTLNSNLIYSTVEYAKKFYQSNGFPLFTYSIQSNGVFFQESLVDLFKRENFSVGISLDGPEQFHNVHRKDKFGRGSFNKVIDSINILNARGIKFGTICVVTNPEVLDYYPNFMTEKGLLSVKFNPYFNNQGRANLKQTLDLEVYTEKMLSLADRVANLNARNSKMIKVTNISALLKNIISPKREYMCLRFPCGAGISMLGIGVHGEVYPCEEMNGKEELQIGNVYTCSLEKIFNHPVNKEIKCRNLEKITECAGCFAADVCGINCANRSHSETKDFYSKTTLCNYYKNVIPGLIWKIYENPKIIKCLT